MRIPGDYGPGFTNNRQAVAAVPGALSAAFALSTAISYSSSTMTTSLPLPTVSPRNNGSAIISNAVANGGSMIMMFALVSILIL